MFQNLKLFTDFRSALKKIKLSVHTVRNGDHFPDGKIYTIECKRKFGIIHFILDTGASCTIFDKNIMIKAFNKQESDFSRLDGHGIMWASGSKIDIEYFEFQFIGITRNFFASDFSFLSNHTGSHIGGLIGTDVLTALQSTIDLKNNTLIFQTEQDEIHP